MSRYEEYPENIPAEPAPEVKEEAPAAPEPEITPEEPEDPEAPEEEEESTPEPEPEAAKKRQHGYAAKLARERQAVADARAEAAYLRGKLEALAPNPEPAQAQQWGPVIHEEPPPDQDSFATYDHYLIAVARWGARQEFQQEAVKAKEKAVETAWEQKETLAKARFEDYDEVADLRRLLPTQAMAQTIVELEAGPELLYWLGKHPEENARIKALSPLAAAAALGEIKSQITRSEPAKPRASAAPAPIKPVVPMGKGPVVKASTRYESY